MASVLNGLWQSFRVSLHSHTFLITNCTLPLVRPFLSAAHTVFISRSLSVTYPRSLPWPWNPISWPLIELESPWTMVIKLPEAITIKQRWPESAAWSELQRREAVYTEPSEERGDTHTRSSQRCFQWDGRKRVGAEQVLGQRGHQTVYPHGMKY